MVKLFVSDLDGTLLQPDERLSDFARRELNRLLAEGLPFTIASARSYASIKPILDGVRLSLPVIEFNGTMATDLATGERRFFHAIEGEVARAAAEMGAAAGIEPFVSTAGERAAGDSLFPPAIRNDGARHYYDNRVGAGDYRLQEAGNIEEGLSQRVVCLNFIDRREPLGELKASIERAFPGAVTNNFHENRYDPGWWWLEFHPLLGTKAHAVAELAESLGVPMSDVTVFGDYSNDIPMFKAAGHAVAVGNAPDEVKAHADEIIGPNTADSVVKYLAERWRG